MKLPGLLAAAGLCLSMNLWGVLPVVSLSCQAGCEVDKCENPVDCAGGVVVDPCGCCSMCARLEGQTCGGPFGTVGPCDKDLVCVISPTIGHPITGQEEGLCKERRHTCESLHNYTGCNIVDGSCMCANVSTCDNPLFDFDSTEDCQEALLHKSSKVASSSCDEVTCEELESPACPEDSSLVEGTVPHGGCCPRLSHCECRANACEPHSCHPSQERIFAHKASGQPGDCCDTFECKYLEKNCSGVKCPEDAACPEDSYKLPSARSSDQCCFIPQGCSCLPRPCEIITCVDGEQLLKVHHGNGKPGSCCSTFKCIKESKRICLHEDREYSDGDTWRPNNCTSCNCRNGVKRCETRHCNHTDGDGHHCARLATPDGECCPICIGCISRYGELYNNSETWKEDDCTTCSCEDGEVHCHAEMCQMPCANGVRVPGHCCPVCEGETVVTMPPECPSIENCTLQCSDGIRKDAHGCYLCECKQECKLECKHGYIQDDMGQDLCRCAKPAQNCPSMPDCHKECIHGYKLDNVGCPVCRCARCKKLRGCDTPCPGGFAVNDRGCSICKCRHVSTTTDGSAKIFSIDVVDTSDGGLCRSTEGHHYEDGQTWHDGCRSCYCHGSQEMCALITCPVPQCQHPIIFSSHCCPKCVDDITTPAIANSTICQSIDGFHYVEGESWQLDLCTRCICHDGRALCSTKPCPSAPCQNSIRKHGDCCLSCPETSTTVSNDIEKLPCYSDDQQTLYRDGDKWKVGVCQSCVCRHGHINCFSESCPKMTCLRPVLRKNQCCPVCLDKKYLPQWCEYEGRAYNSGDKWSPNDCTLCICLGGRIRCTEKVCSVACDNPVKIIGQCCPVCTKGDNINVSLFPRPNGSIPGFTRMGSPAVDTGYETMPERQLKIWLWGGGTVLVLLLTAVVILTFLYFRQRQEYQGKNVKLVSKSTCTSPRPKSTNVDMQAAMTHAYIDKNQYDGDHNIDFKPVGNGGNVNLAPPMKNII